MRKQRLTLCWILAFTAIAGPGEARTKLPSAETSNSDRILSLIQRVESDPGIREEWVAMLDTLLKTGESITDWQTRGADIARIAGTPAAILNVGDDREITFLQPVEPDWPDGWRYVDLPLPSERPQTSDSSHVERSITQLSPNIWIENVAEFKRVGTARCYAPNSTRSVRLLLSGPGIFSDEDAIAITATLFFYRKFEDLEFCKFYDMMPDGSLLVRIVDRQGRDLPKLNADATPERPGTLAELNALLAR